MTGLDVDWEVFMIYPNGPQVMGLYGVAVLPNFRSRGRKKPRECDDPKLKSSELLSLNWQGMGTIGPASREMCEAKIWGSGERSLT